MYAILARWLLRVWMFLGLLTFATVIYIYAEGARVSDPASGHTADMHWHGSGPFIGASVATLFYALLLSSVGAGIAALVFHGIGQAREKK